MIPSLHNIVRDAGFCILFFTRLPLPEMPLANRKLSDAIWAAPLAGWAVAILSGAAFWAASGLGVPPGPAAALALAVAMLATGCLHEDGLSDTADGFGGGKNRERILEIMRDSRIGAYGACALGLSMLLRWSALSAVAAGTSPQAETAGPVLAALIAAHGGSRALLPAFMHLVPPARQDGLGAGAGTVAPPVALAALAIGFASLLLFGLAAALTTAIVLAALFFGFRRLCLSKIGGQTGDALGALQQTAEILILIVASAVF